MLEISDLGLFADVLIEIISSYFILCEVFLSSSFFFHFSYCDQNIRYDEKFRRYSANIPVYLRNRPRDFVVHCMKKMSLAKSLDLTGALQKGMGQFTIMDFANNLTKEKYHIRFGDTEEMPSCSCHDLKKTGYLCKHFFLVFRKFPCWNWYASSPLYRNSLFLMLDSLSNDRNINYRPDELAMEDKEIHGTVSEVGIEEAFEIRDVLEKLLKKVKISRSIGTICREPLNDVQNLTFLVEDEAEVLHIVKEKLEEIRALLKGSVKTDENLLLEPHQTQNRKREINLKSHQLPLRQ